MVITVLRRLKTGSKILFEQGSVALLQAIIRKLRPTPVSAYKPNESDIVFDVLRADSRSGVMIDVGAHYGGTLKRFARSGWRVYAFEPDSKNRHQLFKSGFADMPNVTVDPRGIGHEPGTDIPLFRSDESSGISGLSAFHPTHVQSETVDVTTLEIITTEQTISDIDFLKIDTEGFDLFVLMGMPWEKIQPKAILCEFEDRKTIPLGYTFHDLAHYLEKRGYRLIVSEWYPIERYGVTHHWRRFTPYPCELEDEKGWGNIFATCDDAVYDRLIAATNFAHMP